MASKIRKAMILAAGEGTRLRPLTLETPKPLLPIGRVSLIEHILVWFREHGISEVAINLHHLGGKIRDFLGDGQRLGMKIFYSEEKALLGTAGGVKKVEKIFDGPFVVFYGDNLTDFDLSSMIEFHCQKCAAATIAVFRTPKPWEVGIVELEGDGRVLSLVEKPSPESRSGKLANAGIYILEKEILNSIPKEGFSDFACDVFPNVLTSGARIYGYELSSDDYFIDIGTIEKYRQANDDMNAGRVKV